MCVADWTGFSRTLQQAFGSVLSLIAAGACPSSGSCEGEVPGRPDAEFVGFSDTGATPWEARSSTAPVGVPPGIEHSSVKWIYTVSTDATARTAGVTSWKIEGNVVELMDGTICFGTGDATRWVVCLTREGRFRWSTLPRDIAGGIAGGPTVMPNGRVAILFSMGGMAYADPESDQPFHGSGGAPELGYLEFDSTRSPYSPAPSGCGGIYFVTYGNRLGNDTGEFIGEPSSLLLEDFPPALLWKWQYLSPRHFGQWGGVQGCTAVLSTGQNSSDNPFGHVDSLLLVGPDGSLREVETGKAILGVRVVDHATVAFWTETWRRAGWEWEDGRVEWCTMSTTETEPQPSCVPLEGLVPDAKFVVAEGGDPVAFRDVGWNPSLGGAYLVGRWSADGTLRWTHEFDGCRRPEACLGQPVLGEGGSVLIATNQVDETWAHAVLWILNGDGAPVDRLDIEGFTVNGIVSPILARDGTLYLVGADSPDGGDGNSIIAIQTPVAGLPPETPGWPVYNRRTARGDSWLP
ncbi:MAG: hypothetical protein HY907_16885 [Deltaproteobacteria bacterium]|nr:hypothetical protein [Deltaproteobacteria bacterium]